MKHEHANKIAQAVKAKLEPHCDLIYIGGSIRREKDDVGDIEIVCLPKIEDVPSLFEMIVGKKRSAGFVGTVKSLGLFGMGFDGIATDGRMAKITLDVRSWIGFVNEPISRTIKLDLFMPTETDFYRILAIRTGSAEWVQKMVAARWKQLGWCGTEDGLRLIKECEEHAGKWTCKTKNPTIPPAWQSEAEFFIWLGYNQFIPPKHRV